ncbi:MAG TPA: hypothetical protein DCE42_13595 [Myxococcales bacterium]|mgnify:CR=1 FL=1|nr:hypothetical protein [Deltaproteobacteria bacterium]HAA55790.1 hypothetical protein [Myxococcales bacterium]|tara:strand:+ start:31075 stop:32379 length:1305 start_codon:yes stop_codon:yes gene_type:complete
MNKRALYFGYAVAWLAGVIILSQVIPYAKLGPAISGLFIGKKAILTGWTSGLVGLFATKKATITTWTGYSQWGVFLLLNVLAMWLIWTLARMFHVARRDADVEEGDITALFDRVSMGLVWSIATILFSILIVGLCSTGKSGTLRHFIFSLPNGVFEAKILLGFLGALGLVMFILMANRNVMTIFLKELRIYFTTPIAYVVMMLFSLLAGYFFTLAFSNFQRYSMIYQIRFKQMAQFNINDMVLTQTLNVFGIILLFLVPILTMRLIAEEKKNRTFELLMTSPLTTAEIVIGKYLSVVAALALLLGITLIYPLILGIVSPGSFEWAPVFTGYLGMLLLASALASVGLLCSSLTEDQIIAAVIAFGVLLLLWVIESAAGRMADGVARETVAYLSILAHLKGFIKGVVEVKDVVYYLSMIFFANFLTHRMIESQRWK